MSGVPYVFGNATTSIPLSQLDVNFATNATIGTTSVGLGNTTTTLVGLTNVSTTVVNTSNVSANTSLLLQTNGTTTAVTVDNAQNVGVGVTPSAWSTIVPALQIGSGGSFLASYGVLSWVGLGANAYYNGSNWIYKTSATASYYQQSASVHSWYTAATGTAGNAISFTQAMTLDASGNLGVGITSLTQRFQVERSYDGSTWAKISNGNSTSGAAAGILLGTDQGDAGALSQNSSGNTSPAANALRLRNLLSAPITFETGGTERARIDSSGNLGLGVTANTTSLGGTYSLLAVGKASGSGILMGQTDLTAADSTASQFLGKTTGASGYQLLGGMLVQTDGSSTTNAVGRLAFYTATGGSLSERARIDSSGNLLVGQTSVGYANSNSFTLSTTTSGGYISVSHVSGKTDGSLYIGFGYNASPIGSITQNGTTGVLYNLTSDYRLKNNQEDLTGAKDFIMALKPKKWQWWDGSGEGVGFVAHEFMEVAKYSGHGEKDAVDADGKPVYQSIQPSSSEVMANLVSFIQEQQAMITTLQTQVTALQAKVGV